MEYRHTQWAASWLMPMFILTAAGIVAIGAIEGPGAVAVVAGLVAVVVGAVVLAFNRLTVTVAEGRVEAAFAWGWPRRSVELRDVVAIRRVRNRWWYGWGIRKIPRGWMFNVWGLDAVELEFGSGKVFRIGSDEPDDLLAALSLHTTLRPGDG